MQVTYYPTERKMRAGRKSLIREVKTSAKQETALGFNVPEGCNLIDVTQELAKWRTPFAVQIWVNGHRIDPDDATHRTIDEGDSVVLIQDLSGDPFRGLSCLVCTETAEETEAV